MRSDISCLAKCNCLHDNTAISMKRAWHRDSREQWPLHTCCFRYGQSSCSHLHPKYYSNCIRRRERSIVRILIVYIASEYSGTSLISAPLGQKKVS